MFIIFLDINGVLLHPEDYNRFITRKDDHLYPELLHDKNETLSSKLCDRVVASSLFHPKAIANLNKLIYFIEKKNKLVKLVISSDWRKEYSIKDLKDIFKKYFFSQKILSKTADQIILTDSSIDNMITLNRGEEIEVWLRLNNIRHFLILDDINKSMRELFPNHFVKCQYIFGDREFEKAKTLTNAMLEKKITREVSLLNKVTLLIKPSSNTNSELSKTQHHIRIRQKTRHIYISLFTKKIGIPEDCAELINEYEKLSP